VTSSLEKIGAVDPRRSHLDEKIGGPGGRIRNLREAKVVRFAGFTAQYGLHDVDRIVQDELPQHRVNWAYPQR
jgi:hypothetical protein